MAEQMIGWTPAMLRRFKKAYSEALKEPGHIVTFEFEGNEFVPAYAKYLIEFLDGEFKKGDDHAKF